MLKQEAVRK